MTGSATSGSSGSPGVFGVFYYRSANRRTLDALEPFLPVPREALVAEFEAGATPEQVCARTIRSLRDLGVEDIYLSNLPVAGARRILREIRRQVDDGAPVNAPSAGLRPGAWDRTGGRHGAPIRRVAREAIGPPEVR